TASSTDIPATGGTGTKTELGGADVGEGTCVVGGGCVVVGAGGVVVGEAGGTGCDGGGSRSASQRPRPISAASNRIQRTIRTGTRTRRGRSTSDHSSACWYCGLGT